LGRVRFRRIPIQKTGIPAEFRNSAGIPKKFGETESEPKNGNANQDVRDYLLLISNVHTSLRQASEWGMRGLQGTFPRCKKRLPSDSTLRRLVIEAIVLVHNYRTEYIGYNQIQTVFDPEYVRCENLQGYDRISQYYFRPGE